jgi:signal transduction histidine kinase
MELFILIFDFLTRYFLISLLSEVGIFIALCILFTQLKNSYIKRLIKKNEQLEKINKELIESEKKFEKLNAAKNKLFSIIAHDIRNPFNALLGLSEILSNNIDNFSYDKIMKYNGIINASAKNIYDQLENLLEWSKAQSGFIVCNPEKFDIRPLTISILTLFELNSAVKRIDTICAIETQTYVYADKNIIASVLRNLIDNAIKFTYEGGKIIVSSRKINNFIEISVSDTGLGIDNENIKQLFKLENNFTRRGTKDEKGSGLGLLLCKEFVKMSGGKISVSSQPEKGSTFMFTIPAMNN